MAWAPEAPYNELPLLPPESEAESKQVLRACIEARAGLAELNTASGLLPNPGVLINTLPLLEARASSEIENIVTTTDRLFRYAQVDEERADPATKEALRYRTAMAQGFDLIQSRPLGTRMAVALVRTIKNTDLDVRAVPGTRLASEQTGEVAYTPPEGEPLLRDLLRNWERFLHETDQLDPLLRLAIGHYQFEAIHPFTDGNGRVGRILNVLFLNEQGLLDLPILYLSGYLIRNKAEYYRLLRAVTADGDWESWCLFMLRGLEETSKWTTAKIQAIQNLLEHTAAFVQAQLPSIYTRELVELLFAHPYCRITTLVEAGIAKRQTASNYLKELCRIGVLEEVKQGREKLFLHSKYMGLLMQDSNDFTRYR